MNLSQQQYYFKELQRRQSLLRAHYNLQTQKVGLSPETTPTTFSTASSFDSLANESAFKNISEPEVIQESKEESTIEEPVVEEYVAPEYTREKVEEE